MLEREIPANQPMVQHHGRRTNVGDQRACRQLPSRPYQPVLHGRMASTGGRRAWQHLDRLLRVCRTTRRKSQSDWPGLKDGALCILGSLDEGDCHFDKEFGGSWVQCDWDRWEELR